MTLHDLRRKYPGKICICSPHLREVGNGRVVSWLCVSAVDSVEAAHEALERLDLDGVTDAVAISTNKKIAIEGNLAAKFFRVSLGLE